MMKIWLKKELQGEYFMNEQNICLKAIQWWESLTRKEKEVIQSLAQSLMCGKNYISSSNIRSHQSRACKKAAAMGLFREELGSNNTRKGIKPAVLVAAFALYLATQRHENLQYRFNNLKFE